MNRKYIERQSLLVSIFVNFIIGMAGLLVYIVTNLNALLLDGVFSLIAFVSSLAALYISKIAIERQRVFQMACIS